MTRGCVASSITDGLARVEPIFRASTASSIMRDRRRRVVRTSQGRCLRDVVRSKNLVRTGRAC